MKSDYIFFGLICALLILFGAYVFYAPQASQVAYRPIDVGGGSITIEDQDQLDFVIFDTELAAPGYVTIHKTISDAPAEIIGTTQLLETGSHEGLVLDLTEAMMPGYRYAALLHADNGDGVYVTDDDLPVMADGEVVRPYFIAIPEAERVELPSGDVATTE